jgi:hypothetical protein
MSFRNPLRISPGHDEVTLTVIVEPWANEYRVAMGEECVVVARHPTVLPTFGIIPSSNARVVVWINEGGSTYEFWRGESLEDSTTIPIPG